MSSGSRSRHLTLLANTIRGAYIAERRHFVWPGIPSNPHYIPSPRWDRPKTGCPIWHRVAERVYSEQIDALFLVAVLFMYRATTFVPSTKSINCNLTRTQPPYPNHLMSDALFQSYKYRLVQVVKELNITLLAEFAEVTNYVFMRKEIHGKATDKDELFLVTNGDELGNPLSPLFCYCLARFKRRADIARRFLRPAAFQYARLSPAYDIAWNGFLPAGFGMTAKTLYCDEILSL